MYYGYMRRGLSMILIFCLTCMVATLLPPLFLLSPVVWM